MNECTLNSDQGIMTAFSRIEGIFPVSKGNLAASEGPGGVRVRETETWCGQILVGEKPRVRVVGRQGKVLAATAKSHGRAYLPMGKMTVLWGHGDIYLKLSLKHLIYRQFYLFHHVHH